MMLMKEVLMILFGFPSETKKTNMKNLQLRADVGRPILVPFFSWAKHKTEVHVPQG